MIDPHFYTICSPLDVEEIVKRFGSDGSAPSESHEPITAPSSLGESESGDITFFSDKRRRDQLLTANATACLTTEKLAPLVAEAGMIAIVTDNPRAAFARISGEMVTIGSASKPSGQIHDTAQIHRSAVIGEGVSIGARTRIGANSVIEDGVVIGDDCVVESLVSVSFTKMGNRCHIKSGAIIGGAGFGMASDGGVIITIPHLGRAILHDDVHVGSNSCVDRGQLGDTVLMNNVKIDNLVQVGHNVFIDEGAMLAGHSGVSGSCRIGKNAMFGGRAATADHVDIGEGSILAAFAGVMSNVPDGEMWSGVPAMPIREHMRSVAVLKKLGKRK
ncbi:UDP-3-O-acylglucosamine N-acyltransferase [Litorimonas cladophorae]|uniref:UDP-3-O-acylglucosamine N-acyltransferase n=1 Tax=Litorimonas cladophorae TaxID=1220491 RepID=A0A918KBH6_9PROT|nr:UDP-3-O-(3-hydroxymyristoyl)glucosamine N-acyltransferase [Litorimonas cladophorae]GGX57715.1 UDP-3-O-acylglucosamine N-acyltransferase [Litorimonas cladophorae]